MSEEQDICQHDWNNQVPTPEVGMWISVCRKCGKTSEPFEADYS